MKKTALAALVLAISFSALRVDAHTHLLSTNPSNGAEVTTELSSISLTFGGQIQEGSFFEITPSEGQNIEVETFTVEERVLTGSFAKPLENDSYTVSWTSISEDGHPLTGEFSFTVNVHNEGQVAPTPEQETEAKTELDEPKGKSTPSNMVFFALGLLAAILITSSVILLKRKK